jgi:hypothetical protein
LLAKLLLLLLLLLLLRCAVLQGRSRRSRCAALYCAVLLCAVLCKEEGRARRPQSSPSSIAIISIQTPRFAFHYGTQVKYRHALLCSGEEEDDPTVGMPSINRISNQSPWFEKNTGSSSSGRASIPSDPA